MGFARYFVYSIKISIKRTENKNFGLEIWSVFIVAVDVDFLSFSLLFCVSCSKKVHALKKTNQRRILAK